MLRLSASLTSSGTSPRMGARRTSRRVWIRTGKRSRTRRAESRAVAAASEIVGSKWTVLIVHDLSEGPRRFTELEHACAGISPRTLAERLRWLEAEEIVVRRSYAESPPRVEYELTGKGAALQPVIDEMRRFGHEWLGCEVHSD